jgi:hypothetical protein
MVHSAYKAERFPGAQPTGETGLQRCQWLGCTEAGLHRAPKDRSLSEYYVFCLDHVRSYNAQWNYHAGMSDEDLEIEFRSAATWDRPTWKMGERHAPGRPWHRVFDPFDAFPDSETGPHGRARMPEIADDQVRAKRVLGVTGHVTLDQIKTRYKVLVKKYHPDANGGSKEAENRMKQINAAYHILRTALTD